MEYTITVELPTDTQDECALYEPCRFLLGNYCVLFQESIVAHDGHIYKLPQCPASGEPRYDD